MTTEPAPTPATVVLVHGAWHGTWCWQRVEALLHARGITTHAVALPTCLPQPDAPATLADDAAALRATLDALDGPAIVVGHSYGGMVITEGAADHPAVKHLVYLAAFMPDIGETNVDLFLSVEPNQEFFAAIANHDDGWSSIPDQHVRTLFYGDCDDDTVAWASARLVSMRGGREPATATAWRAIPSTYVVTTEDRTIRPALQRVMSKHATNVIEWPTSHSPFASQPTLVADLLERLARDNA